MFIIVIIIFIGILRGGCIFFVKLLLKVNNIVFIKFDMIIICIFLWLISWCVIWGVIRFKKLIFFIIVMEVFVNIIVNISKIIFKIFICVFSVMVIWLFKFKILSWYFNNNIIGIVIINYGNKL